MKRILVVEDHDEFRSIVNDLLQALLPGVQISNARNGQEGLALALAERPDLILLDIQMPVMDGYEMALALQEAYGDALPPLLAMTNARNSELTIMRMKSICKAVLMKPFSLDELEEAIGLTIDD
ncbi:MAG: response regulator [Ardenticatenaceae bacterium]|nr:response regulator [Anaerolineales bacterium]MCB8921435.1 response regulator [Ardenticatenaceae bacterium]MCB8991552.1 response regulator [Ardenticatenaceae bacterium]MCB9005086.1 response regulator [Ardenticatenaceae bacterium]